MTPEEAIKEIQKINKTYGGNNWRGSQWAEHRIDELCSQNLQQLQAEKARADKAEEMVAAMADVMDEVNAHECNCKDRDQIPLNSIGLCDSCTLSKASEQAFEIVKAHNKRLCDEIVVNLQKRKGLFPSLDAENYLNAAINIVKSVLGVSECSQP